jgi:hypothetical protein
MQLENIKLAILSAYNYWMKLRLPDELIMSLAVDKIDVLDIVFREMLNDE